MCQPVCVCICASVIPEWFVYVWVRGKKKKKWKEQKAENTVTHWRVCGCESVCVHEGSDARLYQRYTETSQLIYQMNEDRCQG